jgi:anti-anti-sigma factor
MPRQVTCSRQSPGTPVSPPSLSAKGIRSDGKLHYALVLAVPTSPLTIDSTAIDHDATQRLAHVVERIGSTGAVIHLDLSGETFIDANGIRQLVGLRAHLMRVGGDLLLDNVTQRTRHLLWVTRTDTLLPISETVT